METLSKIGGEERESIILYKAKTVPKQKTYRLRHSVCEDEVKGFIKALEEKFRESSVQVIEEQENNYKILVEGKSLEDPSCNININLQEKGENSTKIELDLDFKPYYKKVFKAGLVGILVVFAILTVSVGAIDVQNLLSLGYLFGGVGLFAVTFIVLGFFVWNKSLAFNVSALERLYWRLDNLERDVIDQALEQFRKEQLKEIPAEQVDTCHQCGTPIETPTEKGELYCITCQELLLTCSVCLLNINYNESILTCPHCDSPAHRDHLREWLKIKNTCPYCKQKISEEVLEEEN